MPIVIFLWIQSILLNKHCRENKGISCGVGEFLYIKKILDVWEISLNTQRRCWGEQEGWAVQNTALGNCTPSCKPFPVWTGRTHFYLQCASAVNGGCPAAWAVGHTVHSSYTHTPLWEQNSMGSAGQTLVRECICTERQRKMHVILFLQ